MPQWLLGALINMALKFGLPYLINWLHQNFPWIPTSDAFKETIAQLVTELNSWQESKAESLNRAKEQLKRSAGLK